MSDLKRVLVVGSTGYVGTRLVSALLRKGFRVNAGYRDYTKIKIKSWSSHPNLTPVKADMFDVESLISAAQGCAATFYLVHSMYSEGDFVDLDREAAKNMIEAAEKAELKRIIYLGGLGNVGSGLSTHLASRMEVSRILHDGSVPATTLRAAMIIGAGSASFEIMRYLVDRLPAMVTPRWVRTKSQPIAVSNVIGYLIDCLTNEETANRVLDIGGPDILSYQDLMRIYAEEANLVRRFIVPIPILTPRLSSYWLSLVTPLPTLLTRPLIEGLRNEAVVQNDDVQSLVPQKLLTVREAIRLAIDERRHHASSEREGHSKLVSIPEQVQKGDPQWAGGASFGINQRLDSLAPSDSVWNALNSIIGTKGWNYGSWIWPIRGYIDVLLRGKGMAENMAPFSRLKAGSSVDCWKIVEFFPASRLSLMSRLKMPALMTLTLTMSDRDPKGCSLNAEIHYCPYGLAGLVAWYALLPFRKHVIRKFIERLVQVAESSIVR
ncbi:MAG: DUF2867 domain-containing protein [Candidatus Thorarchaeota archaeon]